MVNITEASTKCTLRLHFFYVFVPPDVYSGRPEVLPMNFLFLLFYQSTVLSSHAEDGNQMYFGGLVLGKASTIGIRISPTLH